MSDPPKRIGTQGWEQFLSARQRMLQEFDIARNHADAHEVATHHGIVAEAQFRRWLVSFLPGRFGVCAGYIVSQKTRSDEKAPHYDVVIYDKLDAPVLWVEGHPDASEAGASRAIPAEYVRGVIEVKAAFNSTSVAKAVKHLSDLAPLLDQVDRADERYRAFLPRDFFCCLVFFELRSKDQYSSTAFDRLAHIPAVRGYHGALILRAESDRIPRDASGRIALASGPATETTVGRDKESLFGSPFTNSTEIAPHIHWSAFLTWTQANFSMFAFDIVAMLNGTYECGRLSSYHGMSWMNPARKK